MSAPRDFAARIAPQVITQCANTGLFPSVVIAQAIQESGSGQSAAAVRFNNIFGHMASLLYPGRKAQLVKGGHWWRVYDSISDAITAHIGILKKPLYKLAGVLSARTPYDQALKLQMAGYNDGPDRAQYAAKLDHIIRSANLQQYDAAMFAIEKKINPSGLAFHQQPVGIKLIKNLFA